MITIEIELIQTTDLQARVLTDNVTVDEYADAMKSGKLFPPMVVFGNGQEYWLADGFHRLSAMLKLGVKTATVDLRNGTREDALWHAVSANKTHGLKRSNADKRKAVLKAIELRTSMSDRAIAEHVGVSHTFVADARSQVATLPPETTSVEPETGLKCHLPMPQRIGKDGKSYPLPPPSPQKPIHKDAIGREIPDEILPLWFQSESMQSQLTEISRLRWMIKEAQDANAKVFAEVQINLVYAELNNLCTHLAVILPYAVCPTCQGKVPKGCRLCLERGFISEYRWKTAVPESTKKIITGTVK